MRQRSRRHDRAVAVAGQRTCGRTGKEGVGSAPLCRQVRGTLPCTVEVLGLVGEVFGAAARLLERQRMDQRGAEGEQAAPCVAWKAGGVPTRAAKETDHAREVLAHVGEDWECSVLLEVWVHREEGARDRRGDIA